MAYYGISSNLVIYMTTKLHQGTVKSSNSVTNWVGTIWLTPILGAYVADAHLGRYITFVISCAIYFSVRIFLVPLLIKVKNHTKKHRKVKYCWTYESRDPYRTKLGEYAQTCGSKHWRLKAWWFMNMFYFRVNSIIIYLKF